MLLRSGYVYNDLLKVGRGFLGFGDWNDVISSVGVGYWNVPACVLHDHINLQGSTYSLFSPIRNLTDVGWNDRTSSVTAL